MRESNNKDVMFKVGDWVELLNHTYSGQEVLVKGTVLPVVERLPREDDGYWISSSGVKVRELNSLWSRVGRLASEDFKLAPAKEEQKEVITPCTRNPETGNLSSFTFTPNNIARPILSERKVGKVPVHMVIDGFPRALREVGKVLGWAADAKQYKLHDWKNLPDADVEFPSAGYRHMLDNSEMKADGVPAIGRVDHESHKLHLAHEIFNKLAELELVLTGVIK